MQPYSIMVLLVIAEASQVIRANIVHVNRLWKELKR